MATTTSVLDLATAKMGRTVRHIASQQHYVIADVRSKHIVVRSVRGQLGIVGEGALDPSGFLTLNHGPFLG